MFQAEFIKVFREPGGRARGAWLRMREEVGAGATASKQSHDAVLVMAQRYRILTSADRAVIDQLLSDQLASEDEVVRFDALALIREFRITAALPALRVLADRMETQHSPGAPYEWAKVNRLISDLTETATNQ